MAMSWLFGVISNRVSKLHTERYQAIHGEYLYQFAKDGKHYFAAGGYKRTCFGESDTEREGSFWIGLGFLLRRNSGHCTIFSQAEWKESAEHKNDLTDAGGHFLFATFQNDNYEFQTDPLGLRTLYWTEKNGEIVLSTRIDWVVKYVQNCSIDYRAVGSRWLLFNQLSYRPLVRGIQRLGPDGRLTIRNNIATCTERPFTPQASPTFSATEFSDVLAAVTTPILEKEREISLGLSGGVDSRVLLALLLKSKQSTFRTHTFGEASDPDVFIPQKMGQIESFNNVSFDEPLISLSEILSVLKKYASETNLIEPISTALRLRNYSSLDPDIHLMMDGGFGEIVRRQYLNRLAMKGKRIFSEKNAALLRKHLLVYRSNIFTPETNRLMESGITDEINSMMQTMPDINEIGLENYLDLWATRTRIPNYACDEQTRLDGFIQNYMPFAQSHVVNGVFQISPDLRKNGRLLKTIIKLTYPSLAHYPLVKSGTTYPFFLSTKAAWLWSKIKSRIGLQYKNKGLDYVLVTMKEFIFDTIFSQNVKEYSNYNYPRIRSTVERYFKGERSLGDEISWLLTFEMWRSNLMNY
jgi:hypothetical protein